MNKQLVTALLTVVLACFGSQVYADDFEVISAEPVMAVNVNEADAETIASTLVGVGISRANAIVTYREQHGRFYSAEELTAVKGIGKSTVDKNLSRIRVE